MTRLKVLFVCGRNQWRSPTAEAIYRDDPRLEVRSGGVSPSSRQRVSAKQIQWADLVLVMEPKHGARLRERLDHIDEWPAVHCLEIADDYVFMDEVLIALLRERVETVLARYLG